jgi:RNA polymerase sigma factor (sigma-70 family)
MSTHPHDDRFDAFVARIYDSARTAARSDDQFHDALLDLMNDQRFNPDHPDAPAYLRKKIRWLKASEARRPRPSHLSTGYDRASPEPPPDQTVSFEEFKERVRLALEALPEQERAVIEGKIAEESAAETAKRLGVEVSKIYALTFKARVKLRELLKE